MALDRRFNGQDGLMVVIVITGTIASGKSTLARAVAQTFEGAGRKAAVVDLDLVYEMLDPARAVKANHAIWAQARRVSARVADALLAEGTDVVVVEGEFLGSAARGELLDALSSRVEPRFVTLRIAYERALERAQSDPTRGLSRSPEFLRKHYRETARAVRDTPQTDLVVDTGVVGISEAAREIAEWVLIE